MVGTAAILEAMSRSVTIDPSADFSIITTVRPRPATIYLAATPAGARALLVSVVRVPTALTRSTKNLLLRATDTMEFAAEATVWREPAVIIECRESGLLGSFAAMVAAIIGRLPSDAKPTWTDVSALFAEWEALLARRKLLDGESELGLWGELWCLARSARAAELLQAWEGPIGAAVDFQLDGMGIEVKTSRRAFVHHVSQLQVEEPLGQASHVFMSLHAGLDPVRGKSLPDLVREVARNVADAPEFEERLAAVGYAREDEDVYSKKYAILQAPVFFSAACIPRVRQADPGVSGLRYQVELDPDDALPREDRGRIMTGMGLDPVVETYPCA